MSNKTHRKVPLQQQSLETSPNSDTDNIVYAIQITIKKLISCVCLKSSVLKK